MTVAKCVTGYSCWEVAVVLASVANRVCRGRAHCLQPLVQLCALAARGTLRLLVRRLELACVACKADFERVCRTGLAFETSVAFADRLRRGSVRSCVVSAFRARG